MDKESITIIRKVWRHSGIKGGVWIPHILNIGSKNPKFVEGKPLSSQSATLPAIDDVADWYWTPAVSSSNRRKASEYPSQKVVWVDCDGTYDDKLLNALKPTFVWETSPGNKQAIWLLRDSVDASEFHKDGFMGLLTQAIGADRSGVDIGQLLRVPGSTHHKRTPYKGVILQARGPVQTTGQLLTRLAKGLGFSPGLASDLGAEDPYGDRSKKLWQFARNAAELNLPQDLTFKLIRACKWNKWRDEPERLKQDISKAYEQEPQQELPAPGDSVDVAEEVGSWDMQTIGEFGPAIRKPFKWVVPGIIPEAGCGLLVSAPKVGKTRIAIELALGVATGKTPLGVNIPKPKAVGFFSLEDGQYLFSKRMDESLNRDAGRFSYHWDGHIDSDLEWSPPKTMPLLTHFAPIDLSDNVDKQRLYETVLQYDLKLCIIDTLSMAIGKADVSSSTDMYAILKDIKTIAKDTGCAMMFIHHTRKRVFDKGESIQEMVLGSTALHAWSDFVMSLASPEEDSSLLRLAVQTKVGNNSHLVDTDLKIIKKPKVEE